MLREYRFLLHGLWCWLLYYEPPIILISLGKVVCWTFCLFINKFLTFNLDCLCYEIIKLFRVNCKRCFLLSCNPLKNSVIEISISHLYFTENFHSIRCWHLTTLIVILWSQKLFFIPNIAHFLIFFKKKSTTSTPSYGYFTHIEFIPGS